ncbi:MAG: transposase [Gammaproteobacteria bacterium]
MPRKPRFYLPGVPTHVVQRGNDRHAVFFTDDDYRAYLRWLKEAALRYGCAVHAYVLMTNHVHLLVTPESEVSISRMLQHVGRCYVTYVNHRYNRTGTLWEGRHKGSVVHSEHYALVCQRYIEMNPVRAGMVAAPGEYPWSSYRANAYGVPPAWLRCLPEYRHLAATDRDRHHAYRELFSSVLEPEQVHAIRSCAQTGTPLGNDHFRKQIEDMLGRRVGQSRRGRPNIRTGRDEKGY